ncbi:predicted protein [Postia placenta Mad-698-R]|uniref:Terpene synthase n=1 Tax=Postia placenta MAD-698-R-SB12 TaxID=670580 RepID=A0A1X6MKC7_9APHY|nr:hypothetical protein POSPLADRAFT_1158588 [Postia placenta MAD-698-R-SB12]EED81338.1 predicted protein [Postia placenta Mad-698-R]OSX56844.1 hypothetical protein POSPLADRAFT_1158588 [Postia placenta MAD-698-R-SB12]
MSGILEGLDIRLPRSKISPGSPLPASPGYLPGRKHPRFKDINHLHDEYLVKAGCNQVLIRTSVNLNLAQIWPWTSDRARVTFLRSEPASWITWCVPHADLHKVVWAARWAGLAFLSDDLMDAGKEYSRINALKRAGRGDRAIEIAHNRLSEALKLTAGPKEFAQCIKLTDEWWDSHIHEEFQSLEQYLSVRRVNVGMFFANAWCRYALDIRLSDEQLFHPLMREVEGIVSDHVGLVNDYYSYPKERLSNSDDTNIIRLLMDSEGVKYKQAAETVRKKVGEKEKEFILAGEAVLRDPELSRSVNVHRWLTNMPYILGGNIAFHQTVSTLGRCLSMQAKICLP